MPEFQFAAFNSSHPWATTSDGVSAVSRMTHRLGDTIRAARKMPRQMLGHQPRHGRIEPAFRKGAGYLDGPALVESRNVVVSGGRHCGERQGENDAAGSKIRLHR